VLGRKLGDAASPLRRERPPAWVLKGRNRVEERRAAARELILERIDVEPILVLRDPDDVRTEAAQDLQRAVVGRRLDEEAALAGEAAREEDEALERAIREQNPRRIDAVPLAEPGAKRRVPATRAVRQDRPPVALDHGARAVGELLDGEALGRGNPAREGDRLHSRRV
jgi:hypothetical protein